MAKERRHGGDNCCTKQETYKGKPTDMECTKCGRIYKKKAQETECYCQKDIECEHCGYEE